MEYRQDNDAMFIREKIDAVRKTIGDNTANFPVDTSKLEGMFRRQ